MNKQSNEIHERSNIWMNELMNEWTNQWINQSMNDAMYEWINEWINEWMNEIVNDPLTVMGITVLCHFHKNGLMPVIICHFDKHLVTNITGILLHLRYIFY